VILALMPARPHPQGATLGGPGARTTTASVGHGASSRSRRRGALAPRPDRGASPQRRATDERARLAEVLVDTVTYIVCAGAGLDIAGESVPYVAGWGEEDAVAAVTRSEARAAAQAT